MERFFLSAAGIPAEIAANYPLTRRLCRDYELPPPDAPVSIRVSVTPEEMARMAASGELTQPSPGYLEFLCVQEQLAAQLPAFDRFLLHGAAVAYGGAAYLFTAPSGTGKSTHIRLWRQYLGSGASVINGDKPFFSLEEDGGIRVWGSPWAGKEGWQRPTSALLRGICVLERGADRIRRLSPAEALESLFCQTYHRDDPALEYRTLGFLDALLRAVPVCRLSCGMTEDAVRCSFEALTGLTYESERRPDEGCEEGSVFA